MHRIVRVVIVLLVILLLMGGIIMLYSTSFSAFGEFYLKRQAMWVVLGGIVAAVLTFFDYRTLARYAWVPLLAIVAALSYLAFAYALHKLPFIPDEFVSKLPFISGPTKGSFRWLHLGPFSFQPSEFAKPLLMLFLADYYGRRARHSEEFIRGFLRPILASGVVLGLIFLGKDLSTTVITASIVFVMMFVAGVRLRYLLALAVLGLGFMTLVIVTNQERMRRMTVFRNPERVRRTEGYQLWHSQLALGSGGLAGVGFTRSRMKQYYLPEAHTDFIVAIVGEELGFLAIAGLIAAYCLLGGGMFALAALTEDKTGILLCVGTGWATTFQAFINIAVVSGFGPTTGVTAPFLSYGGSSMLSCMAGIGLILSVSRLTEIEAEKKEVEEARFVLSTGE